MKDSDFNPSRIWDNISGGRTLPSIPTNLKPKDIPQPKDEKDED